MNLTLPDGVPIRGALDLEARVQGTLEDPTGTARIAATELQLRGEDLGNLTVDAEVAKQLAHVKARSDKFRIDAEAQLGTVGPYQTDLQVLVDDLDVASLPLHLEPPLTGRIRARLNGRGSLSDPASGEATTTIEEMVVTWNGQPIATDGPATIRYANQQLAIDRFLVRAQDSTVAISGMLPVDPQSSEGAIDLDAQLNLSTLASYAPEEYGVTAQGRASLTGTVRGSMRAIDPELVLAVDQGFVSAPGAEPGLSNVGLRIEVVERPACRAVAQRRLGPGTSGCHGARPLCPVAARPANRAATPIRSGAAPGGAHEARAADTPRRSREACRHGIGSGRGLGISVPTCRRSRATSPSLTSRCASISSRSPKTMSPRSPSRMVRRASSGST